MRRVRRHKRSTCIEAVEPRLLLAKTIYVDVNTPGATHNGTAWASAYVDLQQGLAAAVAGDEIHVADGTYMPAAILDRVATFQLKTGVTLLGGYAGNGAANPNARDTTLYRSRLCGDVGDNGTNSSPGDNSYHVVTATGTDATAVLDGFTVTLGHADQNPQYFYDRGGGVYIVSGSPTIRNCAFTENYASNGGAIYVATGSPSISNCTFSVNNAVYGAGINAAGGTPTVSNCTFTSNTASYGGGMAMATSAVVNDCVFSLNFAGISPGYGRGGAVYTSGGASVFTRCNFTHNTSLDKGGAFFGGSAGFTQCDFISNTANYGGAGYCGSTTNFVASRFIGNRTTIEAGALEITKGSLVNCTFSGNFADGTGGAVVITADVTITNCTLSGNGAVVSGGAVQPRTTNATVTVVNSVLWNNVAPEGRQIQNQGTITVRYSDVEGGWSGTGNVNIDPIFLDADGADNIVGTIDDDLRLRAVSPVVDAGDNTAAGLAAITTDLAGAARFVDIPSRPDSGLGAAPIVDIGAYEAAIAGVDVEIGGLYRVIQGNSVLLSANAASDRAGTISYAWDLDNDGQFDDATGAAVSFSSTGLTGPTTRTIKVRMTDPIGRTMIDTGSVKVLPMVLYVDDSASGANNGANWANAYTNLQTALADAIAGNEIRVAQGIYLPSASDRNASFCMKNGVSLLGGFAGVGAGNPDARNFDAYPAVLSGALPAANSVNIVVAAEGITATAVLDGFTVAGGATGMCNARSSPTIRDCTFRNNHSPSRGGGMNNTDASPTLINCTFIENTAFTEGGGMSNLWSSVVMLNCAFIRDETVSNLIDQPPAIAHGGAAIFNAGSTVSARNCVFNGNFARSAGWGNGYGAVINNYGPNDVTPSSVDLVNCTVVGNHAVNGVFYVPSSGHFSATDCTFVDNTGNSAKDFFGVGGLANCIVWGSQKNGVVQSSFCDVRGGASGVGNIDADPQFVRSPSPGADGIWTTADDDYGDLRLQPTSPCIDAGSNTLVPPGVTTDLAGNPRIVDVSGVHGFTPIVDMGAYEFQVAANYSPDQRSVKFQLNFDLNPSTLSAGDLVLLNLSTGAAVDVTPIAAVNYDPIARVVTWHFTSPLPDGNYRATLPAGSVADTSGTLLATDLQTNLFALAGDANGDRIVDVNDLSILTSNWQGSGKVFSQGDFNYDGTVDAVDLGILSSHWQQTLPPAPAQALAIALPKRRPVRDVMFSV